MYEYQCAKCAGRVERIENLSGPHLKKCPKCGGRLERLLAASAIQFKGSGWYVTDYARKASGAEATKAEKSEGAEKPEAKESKESPPAKPHKKGSPPHKEK